MAGVDLLYHKPQNIALDGIVDMGAQMADMVARLSLTNAAQVRFLAGDLIPVL